MLRQRPAIAVVIVATTFLLPALAIARGRNGSEGSGEHSAEHRGGISHGRAVLYVLIKVSGIADEIAFRKVNTRLIASATSMSGRLLSDVETFDAVQPNSPIDTHITLLAFDGLGEAQAWRNAPGTQQALADLQKPAKLTLFELGGVADPGHPLDLKPDGPPGASAKVPTLKSAIPNICTDC